MIHVGDCRTILETLDAGSVRCCVTSPPYFGLRDYGHDGQIGLEKTPDAYVAELVAVFREVRRVLADDGTLWLNLGDSYAGSGKGAGAEGSKQSTNKGSLSVGTWRGQEGGAAAPASVAVTMLRDAETGLKPKDLIGIPWRVAFALQADGWYIRSDIIWAKPNSMPESVRDRPTKSHEHLFLLAKSERYFYDADAVAEEASTGYGSEFHTGKTGGHQLGRASKQPRFGGTKYGDSDDPMHATKSGNEYAPNGLRNKRDVWTITTQPFPGAHFAVMPEALVEPCVLAGSERGDTILDPFAGSGTVGVVAYRHGREFVGVELNEEYAAMTRARVSETEVTFAFSTPAPRGGT